MTVTTDHPVVRAAAVTLTLAALSGSAAAQEVGRASAVNPAATANQRTIAIGATIAHRERIQTTAAGSVQLLFIDKTSMTIGPNSDLTLDEYVYNPNAGTGKLAATLSKGALRFVGGQISHSGDAEVKTASAVIGIRGGIAFISPSNVYTGYGSSTVTSGGTSVTLKAGEFTQTQGSGTPPTPPGPPPTGFVVSQIQTFQSTGGQSGGATAGTASPAAVTRAETAATGSPTATVAQVAPVSANGTVQVATTAPATATASTTSQQSSLLTAVTQSAQTSNQSTATNQAADQIIQLQFSSKPFALTSTNCCDPNTPSSPVPFLPAAFATGPGYVSPILGYRTGSVDNPNRGAIMQLGIGINGVGAAQSSWVFLENGAFISDRKGGLVLTSGFNGSRMGAANAGVGFAGGAIATGPGAVTLGPDLLPTAAAIQGLYLEPENLKYLNGTYPPNFGLGNGTGSTDYAISQNLAQTAVPAGVGVNRPAAALSGYVGGLMRTFNSTTGTYLAPSFGISGTAAITLDPTLSKVQANFALVPNSAQPAPDGFVSGNYQYGSLSLPRAKSAYVDYNNFSARAASTVPDLNTGIETPVSSLTTSSGPTAYTSHSGIFVVATPAVQQQIAPALSTGTVNFCQCDYTRWGFWTNAGNRTASNGDNLVEVGHLLTWVAGQLPNISEVPSTGIATYDGMVVASVKTGGNQYVAGGNLTNSVNFGTRGMAVTVSGLDNTNYSGSGTISNGDPRNFSASLTGSGRSLTMVGSFYRGVAGPVAEMGGNVRLSGTSYLGSGIFAAKAR